MIPPKSHPVWRQLVLGQSGHAFKALSAAMCTTRIVRFVQSEGHTEQAIELAIDDLHTFFVKLENLLQDDIAALFGPGADHADQH